MSAYEGLDDCMIFDFETLSNKPNTGVALSLATLNYSEARFTSDMPYAYLDLVDACHFIKFDVESQVKAFGRKIQKDTLEWWGKQNAEAQKVLKPSEDDQSITHLYSFMVLNRPTNLKKVFTRRNTFDPIFMSSLMECTGDPEPYSHWLVKDTISYIEGMTYGSGLKNNFMPEDCADLFIHHDPRHDIALDVMRMQSVIQAIS